MFDSIYCSWQVVICSCRTIIIGLNVSWNFQAFSLGLWFSQLVPEGDNAMQVYIAEGE